MPPAQVHSGGLGVRSAQPLDRGARPSFLPPSLIASWPERRRAGLQCSLCSHARRLQASRFGLGSLRQVGRKFIRRVGHAGLGAGSGMPGWAQVYLPCWACRVRCAGLGGRRIMPAILITCQTTGLGAPGQAAGLGIWRRIGPKTRIAGLNRRRLPCWACRVVHAGLGGGPD